VITGNAHNKENVKQTLTKTVLFTSDYTDVAVSKSLCEQV